MTKNASKMGGESRLLWISFFLFLSLFATADMSERGDIHIKLTHSKELFNIQVLRLLQVVCFPLESSIQNIEEKMFKFLVSLKKSLIFLIN